MTTDRYERDQGLWGQASGSGLERTYVTKPGDTLNDVAGFFYGDAAHHVRLVEENPDLSRWAPDDQIPGGTRIKVSEDASRGDTTAG